MTRYLNEEEFNKAWETHLRRRNAFIREGLDEVDAWNLSEQMFDRDMEIEGNDLQGGQLRVCFECKNYKKGLCQAIRNSKGDPTVPNKFVLQKCDFFMLRGSK
jgi:hypothetical protein